MSPTTNVETNQSNVDTDSAASRSLHHHQVHSISPDRQRIATDDHQLIATRQEMYNGNSDSGSGSDTSSSGSGSDRESSPVSQQDLGGGAEEVRPMDLQGVCVRAVVINKCGLVVYCTSIS